MDAGGILCINKPAGCTSHDVVYKIRRLFGTKQVGHTGTLDPLATGVLVVMVGRAVKASELLMSDTKEYLAGLKLGITTDTEDITGIVLSEFKGDIPSFDKVKETISRFRGEIFQVPPMYSALKVGGKKLVDIARRGGDVERSARAVCVDALEIYPTDSPAGYKLLARVSKGTYIRTLCADIGASLGTGAVMSSLTRLACGGLGLEDCCTLEQLEEMDENQRRERLMPVETLFSDCPGVNLPDFFAKLGACGCELYQHKLGTSFPDGVLVKLYDKNGFFALGRVMQYPEGSAIKPIKQFKI